MRNSLEVVFNLRRGISFDSLRKPTSAGNRGAVRREKQVDEEVAMQDTLPTKTSSTTARYSVSDPAPIPALTMKSSEKRDPGLFAVPIIDPDTKRPVRNYELHPSRNRFFFGGRILTGGDSPWAFIGAFSTVMIVSGSWYGNTAIWWWKEQSPAVVIIVAYMTLIVITTMLRTVRM